ncbi:MAG TPA: oligosaccharide flippase family protein [Chthoniobacterales bacterium]|nr:oligosaccharide flippase family protein [Chthoniobacterales bacterium]
MSLRKQTLWSILPLITVSVLNIVSVPLFYRSLGPVMYALWFYVLTFTGAFGFVDLGLGVAVGRYVGVALGRNDAQAVREYWGTGNAIGIPLLVLMGVVFGAVGVIWGPRWFNVDPSFVNLLRWSFVAGAVSLFLSYYGQFWLILSQAHLDFRFLSIVRIATTILQIIPSIVLAWITHNPLVLVLWGALISALQLAIFVWHAKKWYRLDLGFDDARWRRAREMASYTGKTFASLVVGSFLWSLDRLFLGRLAPAADFMSYTICSNVGGRIHGLSVAVMGPVFHNTSRAVGIESRQGAASVYNEVFDFTFPWYVFASVWVCVWHPVLLRLWLGSDLGLKIAPLFPPIIIGYCLSAISNISGAQLGPLNRVGTGLLFNVLTCIFLVAGVYVGWQWMGVIGVAWAFLFSRVTLIAQDLFVIKLLNAGGWLAGRTWKHLCLQIAIGLAFASTIFFLPRLSLWQLIPACLHGCIIAVWVLHDPVRTTFLKMRGSISHGTI